MQILMLCLFLLGTKRAYVGERIPGNAPRLGAIQLWTAYLKTETSTGAKCYYISYKGDETHRDRAKWLRMPLVWSLASGFMFVPFVLGSQLVETAIVATVTELWPAFLVYGLLRYERIDQLYRSQARSTSPRKARASSEQVVLTLLAGLGLLFMLGSQTGDSLTSPLDLLTYGASMGIILSLAAAALTALGALGALKLGSLLFYQLIDGPTTDSQQEKKSPGDRDSDDRKLLLWLTVLGTTVSRILTLLMSLALGLLMSGGLGGVSWLDVLGGTMLGLIAAAGSTLLRVGNIASSHPAVNALFFLSPLLALAWLMWDGVSLPRFDLFVVGAALIIAINILIQLKPDQTSDRRHLSEGALPGTRFGFTSFILSIWSFGTFVYLRDEFLPLSWLQWLAGGYWSIIALSATVFALILGFRVTRLTARISHEDEMMVALFRECEYLIERRILGRKTIQKLADLDVARPKKLRTTYDEVRREVQLAMKNPNDPADVRALVSVSTQLDMLAHSKQQGRDIVELLSLATFAIVTVGLGLLTRPMGLDASDASWSGFLSEVFILLFASTISFLCVNLFDIRRERETPLMAPVEKLDREYELFFRYKPNLTVQHATAVLISAAMSIMFCVLLYDKWL